MESAGAMVCSQDGCGYSTKKDASLVTHIREYHSDSVDVIFADGEITDPILFQILNLYIRNGVDNN
jgi:hypothetical protein